MNPITFENCDQYAIGILIKERAFSYQDLDSKYATPLAEKGISKDNVIAFALPYNERDKAPAGHVKEVLNQIMPELHAMDVKYVYCADAAFFKILAGKQQAEKFLGYPLPCKLPGYEHMEIILGVNYSSVLYNPLNENKLNLSLRALYDTYVGNEHMFGDSFLDSPSYLLEVDPIRQCLRELHAHDRLTVDLETFSLKHNEAGIGTIAFAWSKTQGVAFTVDYVATPRTEAGHYGRFIVNHVKRKLLRQFFDSYKGTLIFHNATFDIKIAIAVLYMKNLSDTKGLLKGLHTLCKNFDDTKIIAYLALNSCAGNELSLKTLAHEYAGNYAMEADDMKDIRRIYVVDLLEYNLVDACCTHYVYNKHHPTMRADGQLELYTKLMLPSLKTIIQMELTGMPLDMERVKYVKNRLQIIRSSHAVVFINHPLVKRLERLMTKEAYRADFRIRRDKAKKPENIKPKNYRKFPRSVFKPNSPKQLQVLLYQVLGLPIIEKTKTGQPSTGADVLEKLRTHTKDPTVLELFDALIGYSKADKILSTFIVAFEGAVLHPDGVYYLHGSFNLGGTVSGRMSSSDPNLQNIPSGSAHAKLIKSCFVAAKGWLFVGADFASLEAMINALTTKDPNKLTVYENGLDSHSWNAFGYWPEKLPIVAHMMSKAELPGTFYKTEQPDGTFIYQHESEL